ncbi:MAG: ribonuclease H-like domain-containing protein [Anaerolineaceae bacterium]
MNPPLPDKDDLREKMKALGLRVGARELKPATAVQRIRIEDVIRAREEQTPLGTALVYEEVYPQTYRHGNIQLTTLDQYQFINDWANIRPQAENDPQKLLFLDTETTGLSQATGTFAFLIGLGFLRSDGFHIYQIIMPAPPHEAAMLAVLARIVADFDTIVTYNGKSFDIPLLQNRHIMHRIPPPFARMQHIDLLHLARKLWRNRLISRRLGDLEQAILDFRRTQEEVPGWLVPEIYKDYLRTGDARPLSGVFYHNAVDVLSLAGLFTHISKMLDQPLGDDMDDLDLAAIGTIFEDMGSFEEAKSIYARCMNNTLPEEIYLRTLRRLANLYKKERRWEEAISVWEKLSGQDIGACIELAKYYEHTARAYPQALAWAQKGLESILYHRSNWLEYDQHELQNRLRRIEKKMDHSP